MEDLSWERNISFPWSTNINHHQHQDIEETFIFGSENIFLNPIQDLRKPDPPTCSNPLPSSNGSASEYWSQTTLAKGKTVIPITTPTHADRVTSLESLNCLFSDKNSNVDTSLDGISVIFADYNKLCNNITNNISDGSSASVTKDTDDCIVSQSSNERRLKRPRSDPGRPVSSNINFRQTSESDETDSEAIAQMKEMIYRAAAFRPVSFTEDEVAKKRRRKNVKISSDPQTVAARQRRERISDRIQALQKLVPGGTKMDTASMLDEAANYLKFLRSQVKKLEHMGQKYDFMSCGTTTSAQTTSQIMQNINPNVTLGVPFPMQTHFLLPHQQVYPNPPHA